MEDQAKRSARRRYRWATAGGAVALIVFAGWIERRPIAARLVDRRLAEAGVQATYRIAALDPFGQTIEGLRLGDPAHPDLVAARVVLRWRYGMAGPVLAGVEASGVRLGAVWRQGKLSLGTLDRLLPRGAGGETALPNLDVAIEDATVALFTPAGAIRAVVRGRGNLRDGFGGGVALDALALAAAGCAIDGARVRLAVRIVAGAPRLTGTATVGTTACPARALRARGGAAMLDLRLAPSLDAMTGRVAPHGFGGEIGRVAVGGIGGTIAFAADARSVRGTTDLALTSIGLTGVSARRAAIAGRFERAGASSRFAGRIGLTGTALATAPRRSLAAAIHAMSATPLAPMAGRFGGALAALARDATVTARVDWTDGATRVLSIPALEIRGGGAAAATLAGRFERRAARWTVAAALSGVDLPDMAVEATRERPGAPIVAIARTNPYAAPGGRLALAPVRVRIDGGAIRFATTATLDGPVGGGRVEGLAFPIEGTRDAGGVVRIGAGCATVGVRRIVLPALTLDPAALRLCGTPLVTIARGGVRLSGEAREVALAGRSGAAPLRLDAGALRLREDGFAVDRLDASLGAPGDPTRLRMATLEGRFGATGLAGRFADAAGSIARVPLALSGASGAWRFRDGALHLAGTLRVADRAEKPRFLPLIADDVALGLDRGIVEATGTLVEPATRATVARVTLRHAIAAGAGQARLDVPGIAFARGGLQPERLTPLTVGVVANVSGSVAGEGLVRWSPAGTTSSGRFRTDRIDLAAAFGPVVGIAGTIEFTDLLGLVSAPHQQARVAQINPGVVVADGLVDYRLIGGDRVVVEGARWPFAGGTLTLDPATLDFSAPTERRLTFRIAGLDAAAFVQQLDFPNLSATGTFDGRLPMVFDTGGGRIERGDLTSRGAGTLAYVGELTTADLGTMGRLAFDALKAIRYSALAITLDGALDGEIVSRVRFDGVRQATGERGLVAGLIRDLPFRFNIAIRAPFRALVGTARTYADPALLLRATQAPSVQPVESAPAR